MLRVSRSKKRTELLPHQSIPEPEGNELSLETQRQIKNVERSERGVKEAALQELLRARASNGGRTRYGDITTIVKRYHELGYNFVSRGSLNYQVASR
jgi:hypothetical protein